MGLYSRCLSSLELSSPMFGEVRWSASTSGAVEYMDRPVLQTRLLLLKYQWPQITLVVVISGTRRVWCHVFICTVMTGLPDSGSKSVGNAGRQRWVGECKRWGQNSGKPAGPGSGPLPHSGKLLGSADSAILRPWQIADCQASRVTPAHRCTWLNLVRIIPEIILVNLACSFVDCARLTLSNLCCNTFSWKAAVLCHF